MQHLIQQKLQQLSPWLHQWYTLEKLQKNLREALVEEWNRTSDESFAQGFFEHCRVPGTTAADYLNRDEQGILGGIRFRGLDLNRPFVDVVTMPDLPETAAGYHQVAQKVAMGYRAFQPKHVRFFVPSHLDLGPLPEGSFWEKRYLAVPIQEARSHPLPPGFHDVQVRRPENLDFYDAYLQMYQDIAVLRPDHPEYATPESQEDLQDVLDQGLLFQVMHQDQWMGVVAATRSAEHGLSGFVVVEMLLDPRFQGKGFGAAAQRHLIEMLSAGEDDVLFGTIDSRNTSAIRAALKNHRQDIGGYLWMKL